MNTANLRIRLRPALKLLAPTVLVLVATFIYANTTATGTATGVFPAVMSASAFAATLLLHASARWLGRPTAWAVLTLVLAGVFALVLGTSSTCGGLGPHHTCTMQDTVNWATVGGAIPACILVLFVVPARLLRGYARVSLWVWQKTKMPTPARLRAAFSGPGTRGSEQAPTQPLGCPVPLDAPAGTVVESGLGHDDNADSSIEPHRRVRRAAARSGNPAVRATATPTPTPNRH